MKPSREDASLQYQIIFASQLASIQSQVASWMRKNWMPHGNLVIISTPSGMKEFYQPMVYDHERANK